MRLIIHQSIVGATLALCLVQIPHKAYAQIEDFGAQAIDITGADSANITNPPIPPRRPPTFKASPAYIEALRARANAPHSEPQLDTNTPSEQRIAAPPAEIDTIDSLLSEPLPEADQSLEMIEKSLEDALLTPSKEDVLAAINGQEIAPKPVAVTEQAMAAAPTPPPLPARKKAAMLKPIEPAAGEESNQPGEQEQKKSKLVSFYFEPGKIALDVGLTGFLNNHALPLLRRDREVMIEIHAYATPLEGEEHSESRISLARALGVRAFLMENRIDPARMRLKPADFSQNKDSSDRIDLLFVGGSETEPQ